MNIKKNYLISFFVVVVITTAFLVSSGDNSTDNYLCKSLKKDIERIAEETAKNLKKNLERNVKRNKIKFIPPNIIKEEINSYSDFREFPYDDMEFLK